MSEPRYCTALRPLNFGGVTVEQGFRMQIVEEYPHQLKVDMGNGEVSLVGKDAVRIEETIDWDAKSQELALRFGWKLCDDGQSWYRGSEEGDQEGDEQAENAPRYHESLDALLADMPEEWELQILARVHNGKPHVNVWINGNRYAEQVTGPSKRVAVASAVLLACLAVPMEEPIKTGGV